MRRRDYVQSLQRGRASSALCSSKCEAIMPTSPLSVLVNEMKHGGHYSGDIFLPTNINAFNNLALYHLHIFQHFEHECLTNRHLSLTHVAFIIWACKHDGSFQNEVVWKRQYAICKSAAFGRMKDVITHVGKMFCVICDLCFA